jgi:hypothetical protein
MDIIIPAALCSISLGGKGERYEVFWDPTDLFGGKYGGDCVTYLCVCVVHSLVSC